MQVLGVVICYVGLIVSAYGCIWFLMRAFREHMLWGIGCLLLPIVSPIFLIVRWRKAAVPWLVSLLGIPIYFAGFYLGGWDIDTMREAYSDYEKPGLAERLLGDWDLSRPPGMPKPRAREQLPVRETTTPPKCTDEAAQSESPPHETKTSPQKVSNNKTTGRKKKTGRTETSKRTETPTTIVGKPASPPTFEVEDVKVIKLNEKGRKSYIIVKDQ